MMRARVTAVGASNASNIVASMPASRSASTVNGPSAKTTVPTSTSSSGSCSGSSPRDRRSVTHRVSRMAGDRSPARSQALDDRDVGLAAALAHRLQAVAAAGAFELGEQGGHQAGAGGAERVAEGDRAAVHVDLGEVGPGLPGPGEHHRGERLVDLHEVDVVEA